ncbi:MAG TPA: hypothetical protein VHW66_03800 [Stellaceae bacterium]|nr:hypothetical protein [Stellaceae bacterium]
MIWVVDDLGGAALGEAGGVARTAMAAAGKADQPHPGLDAGGTVFDDRAGTRLNPHPRGGLEEQTGRWLAALTVAVKDRQSASHRPLAIAP